MSPQRGCPATWTSLGTANFCILIVKVRTASAPASSEPSVTLNLTGNSVYIIRVWAVNEAGAGPAAEAPLEI